MQIDIGKLLSIPSLSILFLLFVETTAADYGDGRVIRHTHMHQTAEPVILRNDGKRRKSISVFPWFFRTFMGLNRGPPKGYKRKRRRYGRGRRRRYIDDDEPYGGRMVPRNIARNYNNYNDNNNSINQPFKSDEMQQNMGDIDQQQQQQQQQQQPMYLPQRQQVVDGPRYEQPRLQRQNDPPAVQPQQERRLGQLEPPKSQQQRAANQGQQAEKYGPEQKGPRKRSSSTESRKRIKVHPRFQRRYRRDGSDSDDHHHYRRRIKIRRRHHQHRSDREDRKNEDPYDSRKPDYGFEKAPTRQDGWNEDRERPRRRDSEDSTWNDNPSRQKRNEEWPSRRRESRNLPDRRIPWINPYDMSQRNYPYPRQGDDVWLTNPNQRINPFQQSNSFRYYPEMQRMPQTPPSLPPYQQIPPPSPSIQQQPTQVPYGIQPQQAPRQPYWIPPPPTASNPSSAYPALMTVPPQEPPQPPPPPVTPLYIVAPPKKRPKRRVIVQEEEESDPEDYSPPPPPRKSRKKHRKRVQRYNDEDEDEREAQPPPPPNSKGFTRVLSILRKLVEKKAEQDLVNAAKVGSSNQRSPPTPPPQIIVAQPNLQPQQLPYIPLIFPRQQ